MRYWELLEYSQKERKAKADVKHDQFFTRPEVASAFADWVKDHSFFNEVDVVIEPSAGNKDIAKFFPSAEMYDLDPKHHDIQKQDFFKFNPVYDDKKILVVGNPPFGKRSKLALQFINHAVNFADYIAFILPISFKKLPLQLRVNRGYKLLDQISLPKNSFYLPGEIDFKPYDVPAVGQIWYKRERPKDLKVSYDTEYLQFVNPTQADAAMRKAGKDAGKLDFDKASWKDHAKTAYFYLRFPKDKNKVINFINGFDWQEVARQTIGAPKLTKYELIGNINRYLK